MVPQPATVAWAGGAARPAVRHGRQPDRRRRQGRLQADQRSVVHRVQVVVRTQDQPCVREGNDLCRSHPFATGLGEVGGPGDDIDASRVRVGRSRVDRAVGVQRGVEEVDHAVPGRQHPVRRHDRPAAELALVGTRLVVIHDGDEPRELTRRRRLTADDPGCALGRGADGVRTRRCGTSGAGKRAGQHGGDHRSHRHEGEGRAAPCCSFPDPPSCRVCPRRKRRPPNTRPDGVLMTNWRQVVATTRPNRRKRHTPSAATRGACDQRWSRASRRPKPTTRPAATASVSRPSDAAEAW